MNKKIFKGMHIGLAILLLSSCSKNGSSTYGNNNNTTSTSNMIDIANMAFAASSTTVNKGTTVT